MYILRFHRHTDETFAIVTISKDGKDSVMLTVLLLLSSSGLSFHMRTCLSQTFSACLPAILVDMQRGKISRPSCRFWMEKPRLASRSVSLRSANSALPLLSVFFYEKRCLAI